MVLAMKPPPPTRRDLLLAGGWGTLAAGVVVTARIVGAAVGRGPERRRRLLAVGPLAALPVGGSVSAPGVIVIHDEHGLAAVSSRCTHLGCTVTANARGFECHCHGSAFARDGRVLRGPASSSLPWYQLVLGDDDLLRVNLDEEVEPDTRLEPGGDR